MSMLFILALIPNRMMSQDNKKQFSNVNSTL